MHVGYLSHISDCRTLRRVHTPSNEMVFSSSPVLYPTSSSPPAVSNKKKRRLFQPFPSELQAKKVKTLGGFLVESDDEDGDQNKAKEAENTQLSHEQGPALPTPPKDNSVSTITSTNAEAKRPEDVPSSPTLPPLPRPLLRKRQPTNITLQTA